MASRLRELRADAGLTAKRLADAAGWHPSKVSKIEHGTTTPSAEDILAWCQHTGIPEAADDLVASLRSIEGMFVEWRRIERRGLRPLQDAFIPLWERTRHFRIYSSFVVPGPVQTRAYIAAVLAEIADRRNIPNDVEAAAEARERRQHVVRDGDHRFAIVLEESVLRSSIGGPEVMTGQLGHLLSVSLLPSISLGVIPMQTNRSTSWPIESFWMFGEEQVAVELVSGYLTLTQPTAIAMYGQVFDRHQEVAVYGAEARALIVAAIKDLEDHPR